MAKTADEKVLDALRKRYEVAVGAYAESRGDELDDLRFAAGSPDNNNQWPSDIIQTRSAAMTGQGVNARPCLTINKLPQHIKQVTNDQRQHATSGKVIPANGDARCWRSCARSPVRPLSLRPQGRSRPAE